MEYIFHEKQQGSLCAQHCLNALLQGPYFTPVDLATLAQKMDDEERVYMAESGIDSDEYRRFIEQPSGNMDDSGFFSVQVISSALAVWSLDLVPLKSTDPLALIAKENPQDLTAYICNYREHWLTIRKFGNQWFNLNSILSGPELVSTTYLSIFLAQLQQEGYSIFIVKGKLPPCPADEALLMNPAVPRPKTRPQPAATSDDPELERALRLSLAEQDQEDPGLAAALQVSLENDVANDPSLNEAIRMSLSSDGGQTTSGPQLTANSVSEPCASHVALPPRSPSSDNDEALLSEAIRLSLEGQGQGHGEVEADSTSTGAPASEPLPSRAAPPNSGDPDLEEIRRRRLAYLDKSKT